MGIKSVARTARKGAIVAAVPAPALTAQALRDNARSAPVVELVDTADLKSAATLKRSVPVRFRPGAPVQHGYTFGAGISYRR